MEAFIRFRRARIKFGKLQSLAILNYIFSIGFFFCNSMLYCTRFVYEF